MDMDLFTAASLGYLSYVKSFVQHEQTDVNATNEQGWTPLHYAANCGHYHVIRVLIEAGANVDQKDMNGRTALMLAAGNGHTRCLEVLTRQGQANIKLVDSSGHDAAYFASHSGHGSNKLLCHILQIGRTPPPFRRSPQPTPPAIVVSDLSPYSPSFIPSPGNVHENTSPVSTPQMHPKQRRMNPSPSSISARLINAQSSPIQSTISQSSSLQASPNSPMSSTGASPKTTPNSPILSQLPDSLRELLSRLDLLSLEQLFNSNGIDLFTFLTLSDSDFKALGIQTLGPRRRLLTAQTRYRESVEIRDIQESFFADWLINERERLTKEVELLKRMNAELVQKLNGFNDVLKEE